MPLSDSQMVGGVNELESEDGRAEFHREAIQLVEDVDTSAEYLSLANLATGPCCAPTGVETFEASAAVTCVGGVVSSLSFWHCLSRC